jgi:cellulose synthase/poly-beta-1,6-N-acetylglucosamine synthase-like glycosyltransferase
MELLFAYLHAIYVYFTNIIYNTNTLEKIVLILPYLIFELPFAVGMVFVLTLKYYFGLFRKRKANYIPTVTAIITAYNEGEAVRKSLETILNQDYPGMIEIILVVDGARQNIATYEAAKRYEGSYPEKRRKVVVIPKWERGGRASSLNLGLNYAKGEIVMALDGDTSYDVDMVRNAVSHFWDEKVVAVSGNLRIRNWNKSLVTRFQAIEYAISIYMAKQFLNAFGLINNISGAFGIFRHDFLKSIGGWDAGTAEDLDLTLRIKKYKSVYPDIKLGFAEDAIGLTDGPETWRGILKQRQRWDGDLVYLFFKKHTFVLNPFVVGWREAFYLYYSTIFQQFLLPILVILYYLKLFMKFNVIEVAAIVTFIYLIYVVHTFFLMLFFVVVVSERKRWDVKLLPYTLLYPIYGFVLRINALFAYIDEIFFDAHKRTSYVPPWVARRTKF